MNNSMLKEILSLITVSESKNMSVANILDHMKTIAPENVSQEVLQMNVREAIKEGLNTSVLVLRKDPKTGDEIVSVTPEKKKSIETKKSAENDKSDKKKPIETKKSAENDKTDKKKPIEAEKSAKSAKSNKKEKLVEEQKSKKKKVAVKRSHSTSSVLPADSDESIRPAVKRRKRAPKSKNKMSCSSSSSASDDTSTESEASDADGKKARKMKKIINKLGRKARADSPKRKSKYSDTNNKRKNGNYRSKSGK